MKVTLAFVDVRRRWRWFIMELVKLPPEPWQFQARKFIVPMTCCCPTPMLFEGILEIPVIAIVVLGGVGMMGRVVMTGKSRCESRACMSVEGGG
jgi:hypothetical protein